MRTDLRDLVNLQKLDRTIRRLQAGKEDLKADAERAEAEAVAAGKRLDDRMAESKSFRTALDAREVDLRSIEEKIAKFNSQLNMVKTNKEYSALQHEIMGQKANKSKIEDEILMMMEQTEKDRLDIRDLKEAAEKTRKESEEKKAAIARAIEDADARTERLTAERAELAARIPAPLIEPYERLKSKGDGRAMAACHNFVCAGCRMSVTANTVNRLMAGNQLVYCHSCGRILYIADDEDIHGGIGAGRRE